MLDYERLDVYRCALQLAERSFKLIGQLPRGHGELADQLRRAAISIPLNIAEGAGKVGDRERARFFAIARGSAMECGAVMDLLSLLELVDPEQRDAVKALCVRLVSMLSKMCR